MKWILRYLKGTTSHGIMFGSQKGDPLILEYVDSNYVGDLDDKRSTRYVFTLASGNACWKSNI